jgi:exopolyphosphatase/guanosine-5'-triphosphate,3'-diphosphate pyrophosphatase
MRKAVIDLGTNTFNLAIADVENNSIQLLHAEKEGVAIGMGGINDKLLSEDAIQRAIACLDRFKSRCTDFQVVKIEAIGTSAIRDASNRLTFLKSVKDATGIEIDVINGIQEANLIYQGIAYTYNFESPSLIMDIGGGSTEFIAANASGIKDLISLNIGVSRIFQLFSFSNPMTSEDILNVENYLEAHEHDFFNRINCQTLVGASGSFETFYELVHQMAYPKGYETQELDFKEFESILDWIISTSKEERDLNDFIIPIRKKMAPIAAIKTRWVIKRMKAHRIVISPCSLKEGVLLRVD